MSNLLINKKHCRELALQVSRDTRKGRFTRVSKNFYALLHWRIVEIVKAHIAGLPSKGKTI